MSSSSRDTVNSRGDNWYPQHCQLKKHPGEPENKSIYGQSVFSTLFLVSPIASRTHPPYADALRTYTPGTYIYLPFMHTLSME